MSERQALYRSILAAPADDAPRLIFADWLDEQGDNVRADFIRVQVRLAREEEQSPLWRKLKVRERKLYDYRWQKTLQGKALHCELARGFVERITIFSKRFVADAEAIFNSEPVQVIKLGNVLAEKRNIPVDELAQSPHLARLRGLDLSLCTESSDLLTDLGRHGQLRGLRELTCCAINFDVRRLLHGLTTGQLHALEYLATERTLAPDFTPRQRPAWDEATFRLFAMWPGVKTLKTLRLHDIDWTPATVAAFAAIPFARLECLDLSPRDFSYYSNLYGVRGSPLGDEGIQTLVESPYMATLKELRAPAHQITVAGAKALANAPTVAKLRRLHLSGNNLGPAGIQALLDSPHLHDLYCFNVDHCGGEGQPHLADAARERFPAAVVRMG